MRYAAAAVALCLALAPGAASAQQLYRWTDAQGGVHVTDTPPPPTAREVEKKAFKGSVVETDQLPFELNKAVKDAPVTLYTSPSCKDACGQARAALNRRGVPFKEIVVWNPETNAQLRQVSGAAEVPTLTVGSVVQKGFEQGAFDGALDIGGYPRAGAMPARSQGPAPVPQGYAAPGQGARPQSAAASSPGGEEEQKPLGPYAPRFGTEQKQEPVGPYAPRFSAEQK
jgi:glutaredoxin